MSSSPNKHEYLASIGDVTLYMTLEAPDLSGDDPACMTPHSHAYCELFTCGKGTVTLRTENGDLLLCEGDALVIPAQYPHLMTDVSPGAEWYSVGFACSRRPVKEEESLFALVDGLTSPDLIRKYMNDMRVFADVKSLFEEPEGTSRYVPTLRLFLVLTHLRSKSSLNLSTSIDGKRSTLHRKTEMMSLLSYLDYFVYRRFAETIPEAEIARQLFISERQLGRIARNRYGMTLHRAITEKRITTAAEMLCGTEMTAEQIGLTVGFRSGACFYREFSQKYGTTPNEYRKRNKIAKN